MELRELNMYNFKNRGTLFNIDNHIGLILGNLIEYYQLLSQIMMS